MCPLIQVLGVNDHDTAQLVSNLLGQETIVFHTFSDTSGAAFGETAPTSTRNEQHVGRPLMTPDEVRNLHRSAQLLLLAGERPVYAQKIVYYQDRRFAGLFDAA